jgi:hypothetical protein
VDFLDGQPSRNSTHLVKIGWRPDRLPPKGQIAYKLVNLVAKFDKGSESFRISVRCRQPE